MKDDFIATLKSARINPSVQHVLKCAHAGSCHGGSAGDVYKWPHRSGGISLETSNPYFACSGESQEGFCAHVDTFSNALSVARTCGSFAGESGPCTGLSHCPNITISDYGSIDGVDAMQKEYYRVSLGGPLSKAPIVPANSTGEFPLGGPFSKDPIVPASCAPCAVCPGVKSGSGTNEQGDC